MTVDAARESMVEIGVTAYDSSIPMTVDIEQLENDTLFAIAKHQPTTLSTPVNYFYLRQLSKQHSYYYTIPRLLIYFIHYLSHTLTVTHNTH